MKLIKKIIITALLFVFVITLSDIPSISSPLVTQAATTIKISKKTLSLEVGKTATLKITGTKKTVKWSSGEKKIATVTSKGKVSAVAVGKTKITAAVDGKKLTCTVTVTEPANPYLKDAPFKAQEELIGNIDFVMPSDWTLTYDISTTGISATLKPNDANNPSSILISIIPKDGMNDYSELKKYFASMYTLDYFNSAYAKLLGTIPFVITDLSQSKLSVPIGDVLKTAYTVTVGGYSFSQEIYDFKIDDILIEIESNNVSKTDLSSIIEYTINSIIIKG